MRSGRSSTAVIMPAPSRPGPGRRPGRAGRAARAGPATACSAAWWRACGTCSGESSAGTSRPASSGRGSAPRRRPRRPCPAAERRGHRLGRHRLRLDPGAGAEDLAAAGVDAGHVHLGRHEQRVERRDAAHGDAERESEPARGRKADAKAGERARAGAGHDQRPRPRAACRHGRAARARRRAGAGLRPSVRGWPTPPAPRRPRICRPWRRLSPYQTRGSPIAS